MGAMLSWQLEPAKTYNQVEQEGFESLGRAVKALMALKQLKSLAQGAEVLMAALLHRETAQLQTAAAPP